MRTRNHLWAWFRCRLGNGDTFIAAIMATAATVGSPSSVPPHKSGKIYETHKCLSFTWRASAELAVSHQVGSRTSLAKHVPLPPIPTATHQGPDTVAEAREANGRERGNPFVMPPESELFTLRERQRREAREQRAEQRKLKVHEKSTYSSRLNAKNAALRKTVSH